MKQVDIFTAKFCWLFVLRPNLLHSNMIVPSDKTHQKNIISMIISDAGAYQKT